MNYKKSLEHVTPGAGILSRILLIAVLCGMVLFLLQGTTYAAVTGGEGKYKITLMSRSFTPEPGMKVQARKSLALAVGQGEQRHLFIQFKELPDKAMRQRLKSRGVRLLSYVGGNAYYAVVEQAGALDFRTLAAEGDTAMSTVRWMGKIEKADRVAPNVLAGKFGKWARNQDRTVKIRAVFFKDIHTKKQAGILSGYADSLKYKQHSPNIWQLSIKPDRIQSLIAEDGVKWVEQEPPPYEPVNDTTRNLIGVNAVQGFNPGGPNYNGYSGNGVQVMVRDTGIANHQDFQGRLLASIPTGGNHGTHVAGTIGGSGFRSDKNNDSANPNGGTPFQWRGMAPNTQLAGYSMGWDSLTYTSAMTTHGIDIANHSHTQFGDTSYNTDSESVDSTVKSNGLYVVSAAGNNGTSPNNGIPNVGYFSITCSFAKNALSLGSFNSGINRRSSFSSIGPTFDGRIKPDVVAPGHSVKSTFFNNAYGFKSGTSMASPCAAGVIALMLEAYWDTVGSQTTKPLASTMKAILIETARDLIQSPNLAGQPNCPDFTGANAQPTFFHAGPDWATGYGLIDAKEAVKTIKDKDLYLEDQLTNIGETDEFSIYVPAGTPELKVTLAWDDVPGSLATPDTLAKLVNDLDLRLIAPDGTVHKPWVLNPLDPADDGNIDPADILPATKGADHINNVEQVQVINPVSGNWKVRVDETALPVLDQNYSLVTNVPFGSGGLLKWSLSFHAGVTFPAGNLNLFYNSSYMFGLDVDYHFTPQLSFVGLLGYNRFKAASVLWNDTYWWNLSANLKYAFTTNPLRPYINGGAGIYIPGSGNIKPGVNFGLGIELFLNPNWVLELGGDYHHIFTTGSGTGFLVNHAGLIFRF
ncbi:MAG: S8 family serine peptidase [bacterium]|nr:S8 family serine peptidase [bacterium]